MYYASGTPSSADDTVQTDIYVASNLANDWAGVVGRASTSQATYYAAWYVNYSQGKGAHRWELWRSVSGAGTSFGSTGTVTLTPGQTSTLTLSMVGSTIKLLVNGTAQITATDSSITGAGRAGIYFKGDANDNSTGLHFDNFDASR